MAPNLILTGFMGSGKTAVGRHLAGGLGWEFFDADRLIEEEAGSTITEIFEERGEQGFREAEEAVVMRLLDESPAAGRGTVISLGGGAVTTPAIAKRLGEEPLVFLLDEDVETAFRRAQGGSRPLARDSVNFQRLFRQREHLYREVASFVIDTRGKGVKEVSDEILKILRSQKEVGKN